METTISSKFQIVIPKAIRGRLGLRPRQKLTILEKGGVLYLVPERPLKELKGIAAGAAVRDYRDRSDRR
jgi:AbrB family looped-hinge helix DNA binding protein